MAPQFAEILATTLFALAVLHSFAVKWFQKVAARYPSGSVGENFFHLIGEVEVVFGLWAGALIFGLALHQGASFAMAYLDGVNFTEPIFVFVIMAMAATRPILHLAEKLLHLFARLLPLPRSVAFYFSALTVGPLLGSLITEPAAMTVTALVLRQAFFDRGLSPRLQYATLATLFVNVSIGGVLTHFAAPPVVMVASLWQWDTPFLFTHFGVRALPAVLVNAALITFWFRRELAAVESPGGTETDTRATPWWLVALHVCFVLGVVLFAHYPKFFVGLFLFFLGVVRITGEYQDEIKLKEALLVGFFLAGLVVLGALQKWWLQPLLASLSPSPLYFGSTLLTAITDNAALTFLGAQVEGLTEAMKYALVAGAVTGGGLTVIANAPNPVGYSILQSAFGTEGISPLRLLLNALLPTLIAIICFWLIP